MKWSSFLQKSVKKEKWRPATQFAKNVPPHIKIFIVVLNVFAFFLLHFNLLSAETRASAQERPKRTIYFKYS